MRERVLPGSRAPRTLLVTCEREKEAGLTYRENLQSCRVFRGGRRTLRLIATAPANRIPISRFPARGFSRARVFGGSRSFSRANAVFRVKSKSAAYEEDTQRNGPCAMNSGGLGGGIRGIAVRRMLRVSGCEMRVANQFAGRYR